jgi:hypothetical protein
MPVEASLKIDHEAGGASRSCLFWISTDHATGRTLTGR